MKKSFLVASVTLLFATISVGEKKVVDCKFVTGNVEQCMPYPQKLYRTELTRTKENNKKLTIVKTQPMHKKTQRVRVINVEEMIEKHLEVYAPKRFGRNLDEIAEQMKILQELEMLKLQKMELLSQKEQLLQDQNMTEEPKRQEFALYRVGNGEFLNQIAKKFGIEAKEILALNRELKNPEILPVGYELKLPMAQERLSAILEKIETAPKESPSTFAQRLKTKYLSLGQEKTTRSLNEYDTQLLDAAMGTRSLRVMATAYSSHAAQTDSTPNIAAWGHRLKSGMKVIAVSRDLIGKYGLTAGSKVKIHGLQGVYTVLDKMNPRFTKRIDIYMGMDYRRALRWGRRRVVLSW